MKKTALLTLVALLVISLSACRSNSAPATVPSTGKMTMPTEENTIIPSMTLPTPEFTVPNTIGDDGTMHPSDENKAHSETTNPTMEDELHRAMPRK